MNYIIFGFEHYNPLGIARSLGESGIKPIGIIIKNNNPPNLERLASSLQITSPAKTRTQPNNW